MNIVCLDVEGVLVPEIWIAFSEATGIPELRRTTRDEPDYGKLMRFRLGILRERGLGLRRIQEVIAGIEPLPGAASGSAPRHLLHALSATFVHPLSGSETAVRTPPPDWARLPGARGTAGGAP